MLGEPWSTDELALVVDRPRSEIEAMTAAAEEAQLVTGGRHGVRFAHPLVRSELLDSLGPDRRRVLHRTVAQRLRVVHGLADHLHR